MSGRVNKYLVAPRVPTSRPRRSLGPAIPRLRQPPPLAVGRRINLGGTIGVVFVEARLGAGAHGEVWAVRLEAGRGAWALKAVDLRRLHRAEIQRGAQLQRRCAGPGILGALPPSFAGKAGYMLLELARGPSLEMYAAHSGHCGRLPLPLALAYFGQMVHAVRRCHALGVVHGDVKPDNFLFVEPPPATVFSGVGQLKLGDFDAATAGAAALAMGTATYQAPEALAGAAAAPHHDVWALGICLYRLLVGIEPFYHEKDAGVAHQLRHDAPAFTLRDLHAVLHVDGHDARVRAEIVRLLASLLQREPSRRLGLTKLLRSATWRLARGANLHR